MIEVLEWIFSDWWKFLGVLVLDASLLKIKYYELR